MADITINGNPKLNSWGFQVVEDSTPVDPSSSAGGFGQITLSVPDYKNSLFDMGSLVTITDPALGETEGTVATLSTDETVLTVTANSLLGLLSVTTTAAPFYGTLGGYFAYLLGLVGITNGYQVDAALTPNTRINLLKNPSGRRGLFGYGALNGTLGQDAGLDTYAVAAGALPAGNVGVGLQTMTVGTDIAANTTYTISADLLASVGTNAKIYVTGAIATSSPAVSGGWGHSAVTFTTPASGTITFYVLNGATTATGNVIAFRDAKLEVGSVDGAYFDGNTQSIGFVGYYWAGNPDQSTSSTEPARKAFAGWHANIWDQVKALCAAQQVEVTLASDSIIMRPVRQNLAQSYRDESHSLALDNSSIAQTVSSFYYQGAQQAAGMAFPLGGLATNPTVLQVDARQTIVSTIPLTPGNSDGTGLGASLTSVSQPTATDLVPLGYSGLTSVYQVLDQNNNLYPAAKWTAGGGKVTAAISSDGASLIVTIVGCSDASLGPYRLGIADPTNPNATHSSLFVMGTGVFYNKQLVTFSTGNSNAQTANVTGSTIDSFAITTASEARTAALWSAVSAQGPTKTLSVTALGINKVGDQQNFAQMTMGQFDALFASGTFGAFDAQFPAETFRQFDAWAANQVAGEFANQAFGNVAGARVRYKDCWYRISTATITPDGISYTAIGDTTMGDFDAIWAGATFAQFDAIWAGRTFGQFPVAPLQNS